MTSPTRPPLLEDELSYSVIGAFFRVHKVLGFGFVEHVYRNAMIVELRRRGHTVQCEHPVAVWYEGVRVAQQRLDLLVDGRLILELKASERLPPDACHQLFNYLRATNIEVGLVLHFTRDARFYRVICDERYRRKRE